MEPKEIEIKVTSEVIEVSAAALWQIMGPGFGDSSWTSTVTRSEGIGQPEFPGAPCAGRVCHVNLTGYDRIAERLTHYDAPNRQLAYRVTEGVPSFVLSASNHWTIREVGANQSVAEMVCSLKLSPWLGLLLGAPMKWSIAKNLRKVVGELKTHAESSA